MCATAMMMLLLSSLLSCGRCVVGGSNEAVLDDDGDDDDWRWRWRRIRFEGGIYSPRKAIFSLTTVACGGVGGVAFPLLFVGRCCCCWLHRFFDCRRVDAVVRRHVASMAVS